MEIRPITREIILNGVGKWVPCCMYGIHQRSYQCDMWVEIFNEVGGIGFTPFVDDKPAGQIIFLPKKYARRIGFSTCQTNENLDKTMVIGCLFAFFPEYTNRGVASALIKELIEFCKKNGYTRIEAPIDSRSPDKTGLNISFYPFRKFGFTIDETSFGWEFRPETRMCFCNL